MPILELAFRDAATGRPSVGRAYVTDSAGTAYFPADGAAVSMAYVEAPGREEHFVATGRVTLQVPPGAYSVAAERGPEFRPKRIQVELEMGNVRLLEFELERWIGMNERGWYSGDLHGHRQPNQTVDLARAEDLNLATCVTSHFGSHGSVEPAPRSVPGEPWLVEIDGGPAVSLLDAELERLVDGPGATLALGLRSRMSFRCEAWEPLDTSFADAARLLGGHVDAEKPFWPIVPLLAWQGKLDSVGVVCNHFCRRSTYLDIETWGGVRPTDQPISSPKRLADWICELYYRLLNCGFRLPVSGGSASGLMPNPLGYNRTYVAPRGPMGYEAWMAALKAGRSFATNGPMLNFEAAGLEVGETVAVDRRHPVQVSLVAESANVIDRVELVLNGDVIREKMGGSSRVAAEWEVPVGESGWLAARALENEGGHVRFAQSSPVYLEGNEVPPRRKRDAEFFARWMETVRADVAARPGFGNTLAEAAVLNELASASRGFRWIASV